MEMNPGHITSVETGLECAQCKNDNCYINKHIPPEKLPIISKMKSVYHIKKGNKVFSAGQLVEGLFFIYQGKVKITYQRENSEQLIRLASNGEIVGHRGINKNMIYPINAIALEDSTLCFVPMESYLKLTYENKDFGYHMLMFFADELQYSEQTTYELVRKNNTEKTAYALLKFLQAFGANKDGLMGYSPTVHDISAMIYLNVDQVKKALNKLKDHSIIKTDNNEITILKAMQLEKVADDADFIKKIN